ESAQPSDDHGRRSAMDQEMPSTDRKDSFSIATRRDLLKCMAWAGTGLLWTVSGGVPRAIQLGGDAFAATAPGAADFAFVQISDSHIGFKNEPNTNPAATLRRAIDLIGAMPNRP